MATTRYFEEQRASVVKAMAPSSQAEMDRALSILTTHKNDWAMLDIPGRIALLDQMKQDLSKVENRWITAGMAAKETHTETMPVIYELQNPGIALIDTFPERWLEPIVNSTP